MHNSWYFHKCDNAVNNVELAVTKEKEFMRSLLDSKRSNLRMRVKDWLRAYFNINILQHIQGQGNTLIPVVRVETYFSSTPMEIFCHVMVQMRSG